MASSVEGIVFGISILSLGYEIGRASCRERVNGERNERDRSRNRNDTLHLSNRLRIGPLFVWTYTGLCFFFQAEGGIRGVAVTGVQTCALPISDLRQVATDKTLTRANLWHPVWRA